MTIKKNLAVGFFSVAITKYSQAAIDILLTTILARILAPEDFGLVASLSVFILFFQLLTDSGVSVGIVQNKTLDDNDIKSIFTFSALVGVVMGTIFVLLAPAFVWFFRSTKYYNLCYLMSLIILVYSLNIVPMNLLRKNLRFKTLGIVNLTAGIIGSVSAVVMAKFGAGFYAIPLKNIISGVIIFGASMSIVRTRFSVIKLSSIRKIFHYSMFQFFFNVINYFSRNIDQIIIGRTLGPISLGLYERSYRLMKYPIEILTSSMGPVLHPVLSNHSKELHHIRRVYGKLLFLFSSISLPLGAFLFFNASDVIRIMYGDKWLSAVPVFSILAISSGFQVLTSTIGGILQSVGRTDYLFRLGVISAICIVGGIVIGSFYGITGVAIGFTVGYFVQMMPAFFITFRSIESNLLELYRATRFGLLLGVIVATISFFLRLFLKFDNPFLDIALHAGIIGLVYGVIILVLRPFSRRGIVRFRYI